jgi:tetratricopeptide (TPR) repeat protein
MKKLLIITITFLIWTTSFAQKTKKTPSDYFEEASAHLAKGNHVKALVGYQYIVDSLPNAELGLRTASYYHIGHIHQINKRFGEAIPVFKTLLESKFSPNNKADKDFYISYQHETCKDLSDIYYEMKMYSTALHYFALSDTVYQYVPACGNAIDFHQVTTTLRYADIYQQLNQTDKAIKLLLPIAFIERGDLASVTRELKNLLSKKKNVQRDFENSLNTIYSQKINQIGYPDTRYYIVFLNTEITIPNGYKNSAEIFDKGKAITEIKQTAFYKMIEALRQ